MLDPIFVAGSQESYHFVQRAQRALFDASCAKYVLVVVGLAKNYAQRIRIAFVAVNSQMKLSEQIIAALEQLQIDFANA